MSGSTKKTAEPVLLGRVSGVFGIDGWVKLFSYTEPREAILQYRDCLMRRNGDWQDVHFDDGRRQGKTVVASVMGVADREEAQSLVGAEIGVWRKDLPATAQSEFYWADLEGLSVVNKHGRELGVVAYVMATGANDVLVVQGDQEILIPFVTGRYIADVDLANGVIRVDWEWE